MRELSQQVLLRYPRIANAIGVTVGIRATLEFGAPVDVLTQIDAFARASKFFFETGGRNPRIANAVAIAIGILATHIGQLALFLRAHIDALARKFVLQVHLRYPRIANAIVVGVGIRATLELANTRRIGAQIFRIDDAVFVAVLEFRVLATNVEALFVGFFGFFDRKRHVVFATATIAVAQFHATEFFVRTRQGKLTRRTTIGAIVHLVDLFVDLFLLR